MLRFLIDDAGMVFRCCGLAAMSLLELARGEVDSYVGIGESSWDVMAILPILRQLGVDSTIDWDNVTLQSKFRFACGSPEFLDLVAPVVPFGSVLQG